jgi:hypothetical protein
MIVPLSVLLTQTAPRWIAVPFAPKSAVLCSSGPLAQLVGVPPSAGIFHTTPSTEIGHVEAAAPLVQGDIVGEMSSPVVALFAPVLGHDGHLQCNTG